MEDHTEEPTRHAEVCEVLIVFPQGIGRRDGLSDLLEALVVSEEVEEREEHGEGLLHAQDTAEGPFAVELDDGLGRGGGEADVGYDVLAGVVAFGGTGPEEEPVEEGWSTCQLGKRGEYCEELDARIEASPSAQFSILQTWSLLVGESTQAQVSRRRYLDAVAKLGESVTNGSLDGRKQETRRQQKRQKSR